MKLELPRDWFEKNLDHMEPVAIEAGLSEFKVEEDPCLKKQNKK